MNWYFVLHVIVAHCYIVLFPKPKTTCLSNYGCNEQWPPMNQQALGHAAGLGEYTHSLFPALEINVSSVECFVFEKCF